MAVLHRFYCISNEFVAVLAVPNLAQDAGEQFLHSCLCLLITSADNVCKQLGPDQARQNRSRELSDSVVECLIQDQGVACSSLTSVTALCP